MALGRPSSYSEELGDMICARLMDGESLIAVCDDPEMPGTRTIFGWLSRDEGDFRRKYAHAREVQGHLNAELAVHDAVNAKDAALGRLAYDARKWHASKLLPKVYGDKSEVALTGANGGPVQSVSVVTTDPVEAARLYQQLVGGDQ